MIQRPFIFLIPVFQPHSLSLPLPLSELYQLDIGHTYLNWVELLSPRRG